MLSTRVKSDLLDAYRYTVELHAHTSPVSRCADFSPEETIARYRALGVDAVVITNHAQPQHKDMSQEEWVSFYCNDYVRAKLAGEQLGVHVLLGLEMRFPDSNNDYLVNGADEDIVRKAWEYLDKDLHTFYTQCTQDDRVIVQAHPFRKGMVLADPADLDGIEVYNMHPGHNSGIALAARHQARVGGIVTGGTDFHHEGHQGGILACFKERPDDSYALARMLRSGDYILQMGNTVILP